MIQTVISRMASNSFLVKGWSVTLVAALFALGVADTNGHFFALAYFPAFMFWALDAYFLRQERLFRKLYDDVRSSQGSTVSYSMDTSPFADRVKNTLETALSQTLLLFHGTITATIVAVMILIRTT